MCIYNFRGDKLEYQGEWWRGERKGWGRCKYRYGDDGSKLAIFERKEIKSIHS